MKVNQNYIIYDLETGGFNPQENLLTEIAFIVIDGFSLQEKYRYSSYIYPYDDKHYLSKSAIQLTGITMDKLKQEGKPLKVVLDEISNIWKGFKVSYYLPVLVGHNIGGFDNFWLEYIFDYIYGANSGKNGACKLYDYVAHSSMDTMFFARQKYMNDEVADFKLGTIGKHLGIDNSSAHEGMADVEQTVDVFRYFMECLRNEGNGGIKNIQRKEMAFQF